MNVSRISRSSTSRTAAWTFSLAWGRAVP